MPKIMLIGYLLILDQSVFVLHYNDFDEFDPVAKYIFKNMKMHSDHVLINTIC